jgi:hypothetical protein
MNVADIILEKLGCQPREIIEDEKWHHFDDNKKSYRVTSNLVMGWDWRDIDGTKFCVNRDGIKHEFKGMGRGLRNPNSKPVIVKKIDIVGEPIESHPYLIKKNINPPEKLSHNGLLYIPLQNAGGRQQSYQVINDKGDKRFAIGHSTSGVFYKFGEWTENIILCEGYATGCSIWEAVPEFTTICCMNAGNLTKVFEDLKLKYPLANFIIGADNDTPGINVAQKCIGAKIVLPEKIGEDFNDQNNISLTREAFLPGLSFLERSQDFMDQKPDERIFDSVSEIVEFFNNIPLFLKDSGKMYGYNKDTCETFIANTNDLEYLGSFWTGEKKPRLVPAVKIWRKHPDANKNFKFVFKPLGSEGPKEINLFKGINIPGEKTDIVELLNYIKKTMCRNRNDLYEWFLDWCADIFQNPFKKNAIVPVFISEEGKGKGLFCKMMSKILGDYYLLMISPNEINASFNFHQARKFLTVLDEMSWSRDHKLMNKLKSLTGNDVISFQAKFGPETPLEHPSRYIITSNDQNPIKISKNNRRFLVMEFDNRIDNSPIFSKMEGFALSFYEYLMKREIKHNLMVFSKELDRDGEEAKMEGHCPYELFFENHLELNWSDYLLPSDPTKIVKTHFDVIKAFNEMKQEYNSARYDSQNKFNKRFMEYFSNKVENQNSLVRDRNRVIKAPKIL